MRIFIDQYWTNDPTTGIAYMKKLPDYSKGDCGRYWTLYYDSFSANFAIEFIFHTKKHYEL